MENIVTTENDKDGVLRQKAKEVAMKEIDSKDVKDTIQKMKQTLKERDDAVAIAAPQIGESVRIFIMSGKAVSIEKAKEVDGEMVMESFPDEVFINPEIIKLSKEKKIMEEGCISVPDKYGMVERSKKAKIKAVNESGKKIERGGSGFISEIMQHEYDHLEGVLFTDIAKKVYPIEEAEKSPDNLIV